MLVDAAVAADCLVNQSPRNECKALKGPCGLCRPTWRDCVSETFHRTSTAVFSSFRLSSAGVGAPCTPKAKPQSEAAPHHLPHSKYQVL